MLSLLRTLCLIAITATVTIFVVQNLVTTEVAFLTWSITAPRAAIIALVFVLGLVAGYLLALIRPRRKKAKVSAVAQGKPVDPSQSEPPAGG